MVEGPPRRYRAHTRRGADCLDCVVAGACRPNARREAGADDWVGRTLRVDVADSAVALGVPPRRDWNRAHLLLRSGRGAGLGMDLARRRPRPRFCGCWSPSSSKSMWPTSLTTRAPTEPWAASIVVLLWLYISGIALLTGAELNAAIEHASPHGKAPGQKNAQGKLLLGARARRAFRQRPLSGEVVPVKPAPSPPPAAPKPGWAAAVGGAILMMRWWNRRGDAGKPPRL